MSHPVGTDAARPGKAIKVGRRMDRESSPASHARVTLRRARDRHAKQATEDDLPRGRSSFDVALVPRGGLGPPTSRL